jgi:hypothetical protein
MGICRLMTLCAAVGAIACSSTSDPLPPRLVFDSTATSADLRQGDTARIVFDIRNVSNAVVRVGWTNCNGDYVLVAANGAAFYPADRFPCTFALVAPTELAPGATLRLQAFTTGRVVPSGSQSAPSMIAPGTYTVRSLLTPVQGDANAISVRITPSSLTFRRK